MRPSHELFHLIHSLTKSEKRFFKLTSSIQSGEKNYFKLLDYISGMDHYDEKKLKEHFKDERFIKHLPSEKNYLYKLILKSLRQYHGEQSASSILKQEMKNIEILYNKALYKEANKFLKRAKRIAYESEKFYYIIELLSWEKILTEEAYESGNFDVNLNSIIQEESEATMQLQNLAAYHILYSKINAIFRSDGFTKNETQRQTVSKIEKHPLIQGKNTALSTRAASICYYIQGLCAAINRNFELSYVKFNRVRKILDNNPKLKRDLPQRYIHTYNHLMHCYINEGNYKKAQEIINQIHKLKGKREFKSIHIALRINNFVVTDQISLYNLQGKFSKAHAVIKKNKNKSKALTERSSKENKIKYYFNVAYTLFALKDYKESLKYINLILNDNEQQLRQDIYSFTRILDLFLHYELSNFDYLEYATNSALRYLKKVKRDHQIEVVLVKQMKKITKVATTIDVVPIYQETLEKLNSLLIQDKEKVIIEYIDVVAWFESKISGREFTEIAQR